MSNTSAASGRRTVSRRAIATGVAWSVPAIAIGTAVPALAVSPGEVSLAISSVCKYPGASISANCRQDYRAQVTIATQSLKPGDVTTITSVSATLIVDKTSTLPFTGAHKTDGTPLSTIEVKAGTPLTLNLLFDSGNSAELKSGTFTITYTYTVTGGTAQGSATFTFTSSPPTCQYNGAVATMCGQ